MNEHGVQEVPQIEKEKDIRETCRPAVLKYTSKILFVPNSNTINITTD
jgi:hypothetical protein